MNRRAWFTKIAGLVTAAIVVPKIPLKKGLAYPLTGTPLPMINKDLGIYSPSAFGSYTIYTSTEWDKYLDSDCHISSARKTLRERLRSIEGVETL